MEAHLAVCLNCDITISGTNSEVMPGQWEYQIGHIEAADQLWVSRYLLLRIAEHFGVGVTLECKPIKSNDWNGSGCHINFSTKRTGFEGGLERMLEYCQALSLCIVI